MPAEASRPAQTVYLIRHGESSANAAMNAGVQSAYLLEDALLTAEGIAQAKSIRHSPVMLNQPPPELLLVSPLRRTMQTAVLAFGEDVPHQLRPDIQETGRTPCDKGCPPLGAALLDEMKWAAYSDSYSKLADQWHMKAPDWKQSAPARFENMLALIGSLPEHSVAIVGHHDFFRSYLGASFDFAEVRRYTLECGRLRQPDGLEVVPVRARVQESGCTVGCLAFLRPASKQQQALPKSVLDRKRRNTKDEVVQQTLPKGTIARQRRVTKELYEQEVELERKRTQNVERLEPLSEVMAHQPISGFTESAIRVPV